MWLGDATGAGTITIGGKPPTGAGTSINTWYTMLPMTDDGKSNRAYREADVVVLQHGRLYLTDDMTVADLDLREAVGNKQTHMNTNVCLNGHVLTIRSKTHKDGKGWYKDWEKWVDYGTNSVTGAKGKIVWKGGMCLIIR